MARVTNTLIGHSYGKVGGAVFSVWKGINVLKEKGIPTNPQTDAQQAQRALMALFVSVYQQLAVVFKLGFKELAVKKSEFNAFISTAFSQGAYDGTYPSFTLDPDLLLASKGSLWPTPIATMVSDLSAGTTVVTFATTATSNQSVNDEAVVALYNVDRGTWNGQGGALRSTGTQSSTLPPLTQVGDEIKVYLFFVQSGTNIVSTSELGTDTVVA